MGKTIRKVNFWIRRRSHLPLIAVCTLIIMVLFFNEDTSITLNVEYDREINELTREIEECLDSAAYYRSQREALIRGEDNLEHIAREQFHMQKPSEDVYILR